MVTPIDWRKMMTPYWKKKKMLTPIKIVSPMPIKIKLSVYIEQYLFHLDVHVHLHGGPWSAFMSKTFKL